MRIPSGDLAPARRRRRRYGRRRRTGPVLLVIALLAAVGGGAYLLQRDDDAAGRRLAQSRCPTPAGTARPATHAAAAAAHAPARTARAAAALPAPGQVRVAVVNGTGRDGLGRTVGDALAARGFSVTGTGNAAGPLAGPAQVRFGPQARPGATLLVAQVLGARLHPVPALPAGTVQLYLGSSFVRLRTPAETAAQHGADEARAEAEAQAGAEPDQEGPGCDPVPMRALVVDDAGVLSGTCEPLTEVVRQLRAAGHPTAVLSNADGPPRRALTELVDLVVLCGSDALRKPDPAVFRAVAERLGVAPQECVFVDDLPRNVRGAVAAGMVGVVHRDLATTTEELRVLFGK